MTNLRELLRETRDAAKDCSFIIAAWLSNPRERPDLESSASIALKRWLELEPKLSDAALAQPPDAKPAFAWDMEAAIEAIRGWAPGSSLQRELIERFDPYDGSEPSYRLTVQACGLLDQLTLVYYAAPQPPAGKGETDSCPDEVKEKDAEIERLRATIAENEATVAQASRINNAFERAEAAERELAELQERMMVLLALQLKRFEPETVPATPDPVLAVPGHLKGEPDGRGHNG
jgi:hypothetical protein